MSVSITFCNHCKRINVDLLDGSVRVCTIYILNIIYWNKFDGVCCRQLIVQKIIFFGGGMIKDYNGKSAGLYEPRLAENLSKTKKYNHKFVLCHLIAVSFFSRMPY